MEHEADAVPALAGLHVTDEEHVVARTVHRVVAALEPRDATLDQRRVRGTQPKGNALEAVGVGPREAAREIDLIVRCLLYTSDAADE